jgi:quercetin dioxygenase-like cupin family protein
VSAAPTFYDEWLGYWNESQQRRAASRRVIHREDLSWVETRQDAACAELISHRTGFANWGTVTLLARIPVSAKTGRHQHGEEAIYIVSGRGCSVVDGRRYDWAEGSCLLIPFGAVHQHYNLGDEPVEYLSCMTPELDHFLGLSRTEQLEDHGPLGDGPDLALPVGTHDEKGRRVVLPLEHTITLTGVDNTSGVPPATGEPLVIGDFQGMQRFSTVHHHRVQRMMRIGTDINDFEPKAVEISGLLVEEPRTAGGDHAHMEAHLYVLEGEGYTVVDGVRYPWRAGSAVHIPGPQSRHQHFNTGDGPSKMVRIAFGVRYLLEQVAKPAFPYLYFAGKRQLEPQDA